MPLLCQAFTQGTKENKEQSLPSNTLQFNGKVRDDNIHFQFCVISVTIKAQGSKDDTAKKSKGKRIRPFYGTTNILVRLGETDGREWEEM